MDKEKVPFLYFFNKIVSWKKCHHFQENVIEKVLKNVQQYRSDKHNT